MEEVERWWKLAKDDLKSAKINYKTKQYYVCVFLCQQAVEKGLKALLIKKTNELIKIHDLIILGRKVDLPEDILALCDRLNSVYTDTRYGDVGMDLPSKRFNKDNSNEFLNLTQEILKWLKKNI